MDIPVSTIETCHQNYVNLDAQIGKLTKQRDQLAKDLLTPIVDDLVDKLRITRLAITISYQSNDEGDTYESVRYRFENVITIDGQDETFEYNEFEVSAVLNEVIANVLAGGTEPGYTEMKELLASPAGLDLKASLLLYQLHEEIQTSLLDAWEQFRPVKDRDDSTWRFGEDEDFDYD